MRLTGRCKWFNNTKGYGFILAEGVDQDIFVHYSEIQMEGYKTLKENAEVEFELIESDKGPQAHKVSKVE